MPKPRTDAERAKEKYWAEYWRAQQNRDKRAFFPSSLPGSRGAISPLGGVAKPEAEAMIPLILPPWLAKLLLFGIGAALIFLIVAAALEQNGIIN